MIIDCNQFFLDIPNLTRVQNRNFHLFIDSYSNHCLHLSSLSDVFIDILGFLTIFQYKKSAQVVNFNKISYVTIIFFSSPGPFSAIALRFRFSGTMPERERNWITAFQLMGANIPSGAVDAFQEASTEFLGMLRDLYEVFFRWDYGGFFDWFADVGSQICFKYF